MRVELNILEDETQTNRGVLRALGAMCFMALFSFLWYELTRRHIPTGGRAWVGIIMVFILVGSAIAVQFPTDAKSAVGYGALVGLFAYGVGSGMLLINNCNESLSWALADVTRGVVSTALTAFLVYKVFY